MKTCVYELKMDLLNFINNVNSSTTCNSSMSDVYFLIQRFLSNGPLRRTLQVLNEELHDFKLLPKRIDWQGNEHERSVEDMRKQYPHIHEDFLYFLCSQASIHLNPNSSTSSSLLSFRPRTQIVDGIYSNFRQYFNYVRRHQSTSQNLSKASFNIVNSIRGQEVGGPYSKKRTITPKLYSAMQMQRLTIGHLSAVYCLLFDNSGRYVITGADDLLIKVWSVHSGRLIGVFRGASSEITDIAIDSENFLLAAGSIDRILRVWNLKTGVPIAVLTGHTGMITSVNFCPTLCWGHKYLISTSTDGSIAFWTYNSNVLENKVEFRNTPILYQEKIRPGQAQMICSSFSPGGTFLATGSADHHVRVYHMKGDEGPQRILETEAHTDRVDSIQWAHSGLKFLSGSKDGTAIIWWFERQQWKNIYLDMSTKLPGEKEKTETETKKIRVTMVAWDRSDLLVVTAVSDHTLKVWSASNGQLLRVLSGHDDEVYVLEPHPHDENVILSAGHDGQLIIWNILSGEIVFKYLNTIEGQGYGAVFDAKWSPDGCIISASDSHGDILTFGFGSGSPFYQQLPKELFFHTDYRPLVRDQNFWVLDEQTQVPPHLMPPPFLVDIDGNPYPPMLQRLVPGRESCNVEHLVPNIVIGNEGVQEVIQDVQPPVMDDSEDEDVRGNAGGSLRSQRIRQSTGDWQTDHNIEWQKNVLIPPLCTAVLERSNEIRRLTEVSETKEYQKQLRRRPLMISTAGPSTVRNKDKKKKLNSTPKKSRASCRPFTEDDLERYDVVPLNMNDGVSDESSISDWAEEVSHESRKKRRRTTRQRNNAHNRSRSSSQDEDDESEDDTEDTDQSDEDSDDSRDTEQNSDRKTRKEKHRAVKTRPTRSSPKPSTSRPSTSRATVPRNNIIPKKDPVPKTAQTAKIDAAEPSTSGAAPKGPKIKISEQYKLSEWLAETRPKKSPYYPQIHDEIVYFVQGHILYVEAVKHKSIYEPNIKELPWVKGLQLRDHEFCRVVGIRYEIKPPRLCCLKLALQDESGRLTGKYFTIRFHDMPDVLDFLVLKQSYLAAVSRNWLIGERFRCMIDDNWWIGEISNKSPASDIYPESAFMSYEISWTNGEQERMSPWDMEPIDDTRIPEDEKESIPVLANELRNILYKPVPEDWPNCERDTACKAIARGITQVMELAIAEPFLVPVDINAYPTYALVVEYPIDLSTLKARFENNFYRRISAAQFDIRYLETNAIKFNEKASIIVKHAKIITELCQKIVRVGNDVIDIAQLYHQLVEGYDSGSHSSDSEIDVEAAESQPTTSRTLRIAPVRSWKSPNDWKAEAGGLLELMWQTEDSVPFRDPVNKHKYPTYHQVVHEPMDLSTVKERLRKDYYNEPNDFCQDMRLIFQNSRTFNTNKRSRIYVMTVRLSAMFEEHIKKIISNWRVTRKRRRRLTSSDDSDSSVGEAPQCQEPTGPKVIVETINPITNGLDSDSDTPGRSSIPAYQSVISNQNERLAQNGLSDPEPSMSSRSMSGDFEHCYSNRLSSPSNKERKEDCNNALPSTSGLGTGSSRTAVQNGSSVGEDSSGEEWNLNSKEVDPLESQDASSETEDEDLQLSQLRNELRKKTEMDNIEDDDDDEDSSSKTGFGKNIRRRRKIESSEEDFSNDREDSSESDKKPKGNRKRRKESSDEDFQVNDPKEESSDSEQRPMNRRRRKEESSDEDFQVNDRKEESSDSENRPLYRGRRKESSDEDFEVTTARGGRRKRKSSFVVDEHEGTPSDSCSVESEGSSDDDLPLRKSKRAPRKNRSYDTSDSESDSRRTKRKRRKILVSESRDSDTEVRRNGNRSGGFGSVSSRGRVRKITERAAAFMKKDKKSG